LGKKKNPLPLLQGKNTGQVSGGPRNENENYGVPRDFTTFSKGGQEGEPGQTGEEKKAWPVEAKYPVYPLE